MKSRHDADRPPRLSTGTTVLRMLHCRGLPCHGVLPLQLEGCGMADALALAESLIDDDVRRDANRCRIIWQGSGWMLSNESRWLVCALNGRRITTGQQTAMQVGNVLEVGLTRFLLEG